MTENGWLSVYEMFKKMSTLNIKKWESEKFIPLNGQCILGDTDCYLENKGNILKIFWNYYVILA